MKLLILLLLVLVLHVLAYTERLIKKFLKSTSNDTRLLDSLYNKANE